MAPGQVGELGVQRGGPPRIVPDAPVGDDGRAVVGLEVVTEVLGAAEKVDPDGLAPGPDVGDPVAEQFADVVLPAPQRRRLRAGRGRRGVRLHRGEHLADEAFGGPVEQADGPAGAAHPGQLVCAGLVERREHDAQARHDRVELAVGERQVLGVGLPPFKRRSASFGRPPPGLEQFRGEVAGYYAGPGLGRGDRGVAGSGGHVEHPVSGPDLARFDEDGAEARHEVGGHGRVVAERPHGAVPRLQRPARFGGIRGLSAHFGSPPPCLSVDSTLGSAGPGG